MILTLDRTADTIEGGGVLFEIGEPEEVLWFAEGRVATRKEVQASIDSGLPLLEECAHKEGDNAMQALRHAIQQAMPLLPAAENPAL